MPNRNINRIRSVIYRVSRTTFSELNAWSLAFPLPIRAPDTRCSSPHFSIEHRNQFSTRIIARMSSKPGVSFIESRSYTGQPSKLGHFAH